MSRLRLLQDCSTAERDWMSEVAVVFGDREAGMARFDGRGMGEAGSRLRDLYGAYVKAREAYEAN